MSEKKKILFVAAHRKDRAPGQRFRFEQYFDFLEKNGFSCELSFLLNAEEDKAFYRPGNYLGKSYIAAKSWVHRWRDTIRASHYDIIFIFREAYFTGSTFLEKKFSRSRARLVFDFDDAIWHLDVSEGNKRLSWLKNPGKTGKIISYCDLVFAGNEYLADYARQFNKHVVIVPTTIDTNEYTKPPSSLKNSTICIGWSGSVTTIQHFNFAVPVLRRIKKKYGKRVSFKVVGDGNYVNEELGIKGLPWKKEDEVREISSMDIGIMPLPDDEWAKGKCGLKGLQYMALEVATVMSPVGVNSEIIQQGENGFLASTEDEWFESISRLIDDEALRARLGGNARKTVLDKYSVESQKGAYLKYFQQLTT